MRQKFDLNAAFTLHIKFTRNIKFSVTLYGRIFVAFNSWLNSNSAEAFNSAGKVLYKGQ